MFSNASRFFTTGHRAAEAWHAANDARLIEAMRAQARENHAAMLNQFGGEAFDPISVAPVSTQPEVVRHAQEAVVAQPAGALAMAA